MILRIGHCSNLFDIVSYSWTYYNCFQLNFKSPNVSINTLTSLRAESIPGLLYAFWFTNSALNITSQTVIAYNNNGEYSRLGYFRGIFLSELNHLIILTNHEYSNTLLPSPYVTNCRSYRLLDQPYNHRKDDDIIDRGTCFDSCIKNRTFSKFGSGVILPSIIVFDETIKLNPKYQHMTVDELYSNKSLMKLRNELSIECNMLCNSPTCYEDFHLAILKSSIEFPYPSIGTYAMDSPKIDTTCSAKLSFVNYITSVFSTFGFWVGLSIFSIVDIMTDFIVKHFKRFMNDQVRDQLHQSNIVSIPQIETRTRNSLLLNNRQNYRGRLTTIASRRIR